MTKEVLCNGAGEMPGHEGEGSCDENYESWIEANKQLILEKFVDEATFEDVPDHFISTMYEVEMELE